MNNKDSVLKYDHLKGKKVVIKFSSGREVEGELKGYDAVGNIVLDDAEETMNSNEGNNKKRFLGVLIARGPNISVVLPKNSLKEIENL